jgi:DNA-binding MarR family transcriptional regulator
MYPQIMYETEGLIEIAVVEADLRRRAVWLTETGARRLEAAIAVWRRAHARLSKRLSPALARRLADEAEALIIERA